MCFDTKHRILYHFFTMIVPIKVQKRRLDSFLAWAGNGKEYLYLYHFTVTFRTSDEYNRFRILLMAITMAYFVANPVHPSAGREDHV